MTAPNYSQHDRVADLPSMVPVEGSPIPDQFWSYIAADEFRLPKCQGCGEWRWYPLPLCDRCGTQGFDWVLAPMTGIVFSYSIVHHNFLPPTASVSFPFAVGLIELDGAPQIRFVTNILVPGGAAPRIGDRGRLVMTPVADRTVPVFKVSEVPEVKS
jgi:uncharacterized protein